MFEKLPRPFKIILKIALLPAAFFLLSAIFAYFFLAQALELERRIPKLLAEKLGVECSIGKVHVIFLPKPGIELDDMLLFPQGETLAANACRLESVNASALTGDLSAQNNASLIGNSTEMIAPLPPPRTAEADSAPPAPDISHLKIGNLAVYLDIPKLFEGKLQPSGLSVSNLALNLTGLEELSRITQNILEKVKEAQYTQPGLPLPPVSLLPGQNAENEKPEQLVIVEESTPETAAWIWEMLKKVSLSEVGIFLRSSSGAYEPLCSHLKLKEFFGKLSLSFVLNIPINAQPYAINMRLDASNFKADFDSLSFELIGEGKDTHGFAGKLNTRIRYEQSLPVVFFDQFRLETGKTRLVSNLRLNLEPKQSEWGWQLKGPAQLNDFALPYWVPPLTDMSAEMQTLLGQINGNLELELNPSGLFLNDIDARSGPYPWQGYGKILFPTPDMQLEFYLKTPELPLEIVFPALVAPGEAPRFNGPDPHFSNPYFLQGEIENAPPLELVLEVDNLLLRGLRAGSFRAEMHNYPDHVRWDLSAADLADGELKSTILDNDDYTLVSQGVLTGSSLETLLPGMGWQIPVNGRTNLDYKLEGPTSSPEDFLENMRLELKANGTNLLLDSPGTKMEKGSARRFNLFEQASVNAVLEGQKQQKQQQARFMLSGNISAQQQKDELALKAKGQIILDSNDYISLPGLDLEGKIASSLAFLGFSKRQSGKVKAQVQYSEANNNCTVGISHLELAGLTAKAGIKGKNLNTAPDFSGELNLETANLRKFLYAMGASPPDIPEPLLQKSSLKTGFASNHSGVSGQKERTFTFSNLEFKLDYMHFQGKAGISNKETLVELTVDELDFDAYFPDRPDDKKSESAPWNLAQWLDPRLQINLSTPSLRYMKLPGKNMNLRLVSGQGKVKAELSGLLCNGKFYADLRGHNQDGALASKVSLRLENASIEQISLARSGEAMLTGELELSLDIHGSPRSFDDIPAAFSGQWAFNIGKGYFVRSQTGGPAGSRKGPVHTNFDFVKGAAKMQAGVLVTDDLLMRGPSAYMEGRGKVDLVKKEIDIAMDMNMGGVAFPVNITGTLADPQLNLRGGRFVTSNITNLGGGLIDLIGGVITLPIRLVDELSKE